MGYNVIHKSNGKNVVYRNTNGIIKIYNRPDVAGSIGSIAPFSVNVSGDPHFKIYTLSSTGAQNYLAQWDDNGGTDNSEILVAYIKTDTTETSIYYTKQIYPRYSPAKSTKSIRTVVNGTSTIYSLASSTLDVNVGPIYVGPLSLYIIKKQDGTHTYFDWIIKSSKIISNVYKFGGGIPIAFKKAIALNSSILSSQALINVDPRSDWQAGPTVVAGQSYIISATGTVGWGYGTSGPDGVVHPYARIDNRFLHEALLGKIGSGGSAFLIGSGLTYTATSSGVLYMTTNDTNRGDNSGYFYVNITDAAVSWTGPDGPTADGFSDAGSDLGITLSDLENAASSGLGTSAYDKVSFDGSSFSNLETLLGERLSPTARTTFSWDPLPYTELDPLMSEPISLSGVAYDSAVVLSWTAPTNYGPSITDYLIEYSNNGGITWTTFSHSVLSSTSITVTGLLNNTQYIFRVSAINSTGTGPASDNSSNLTPLPASTPSEPININGAIGVDYVVLSWTSPANINGALIIDYVVQYSNNNGYSWTTFSDEANSNTTSTITGLVAGYSYTFRVAATNSAGTGSYSANSSSFAIPTEGIVVSTNFTPRALVGGGVTYNPAFINSDYRSYYSQIIDQYNYTITNGRLPYDNLWNNYYLINGSGTYYFDFIIPTVLTKYRLWNPFKANVGNPRYDGPLINNQHNIYQDLGNQTPQSWKVQGTNDDVTWVDVDVRTSQARLPYATSDLASTSAYGEFSISSPTAYKTYRLVVTGYGRDGYNCNKSGCSYDWVLGEIQLWGYESPSSTSAIHGYYSSLPTVQYLNSNQGPDTSTFKNAFFRSGGLGRDTRGPKTSWDRTSIQYRDFVFWDIPARAVGQSETGYIGFDYGVVINSYSMRTDVRIDGGAYTCLSAWELYGSNDFSSWNLLDSRSGVTSNSISTTYSFANSISYKYYKFIAKDGYPKIYCDKSGNNCSWAARVADMQLKGYII
jgi:hypothetical protein